MLQQATCQAMQFLDVLREQPAGLVVGTIDDVLDLAVDFPSGGLGHVLVLGDGVSQEHFLAVVAVGDHAEFFRHAPFGDHPPGLIGGHLDVPGRTVGDLIRPEDDFLGRAAPHRHGQFGQQLGLGFGVAVALRQAHDQAERPAARNDCRLVDGVAFRFMHRAQGMARFVVGGHPLLGFRHDQRPAFGAHHDFVLGGLELRHRDDPLAQAGGQ